MIPNRAKRRIYAFRMTHCTINEEIVNGKLHFLCNDKFKKDPSLSSGSNKWKNLIKKGKIPHNKLTLEEILLISTFTSSIIKSVVKQIATKSIPQNYEEYTNPRPEKLQKAIVIN